MFLIHSALYKQKIRYNSVIIGAKAKLNFAFYNSTNQKEVTTFTIFSNKPMLQHLYC